MTAREPSGRGGDVQRPGDRRATIAVSPAAAAVAGAKTKRSTVLVEATFPMVLTARKPAMIHVAGPSHRAG